MKKYLLIILSIGVIFSSCTKKVNENSNPLLAKYDTPFEVPPFEKIKTEHFAPAFDSAMVLHKAEMEAIMTNPEEPTFENTIEASFYAGELLGKVAAVFGTFNSVNISDSLQMLAQEIYPKLSAHSDEISLDLRFWERVKIVYANKKKFNLNAEQAFLLESVYKGFVRNGANLPEDKKEELMKINQELSTIALTAEQNILSEVNQYNLVIDNEKDLAGLPESSIQAAAEEAINDSLTGKWVFTLNKPSLIPFLNYAENRDLRRDIYNAYVNQGNNNDDKDNKALMAQMINLRVKRAKLLGYESHAAYKIEGRMAQNPDRAIELLTKLWGGILPKVQQERNDLQSVIAKEGGNFKLEPSDWFYYTEKLRKEKYNIDENEVRPYFKLENVREGAFAVANKLYGITFTEINNVPLPNPEATAFEVKEADGTFIGLLFTDFHPRPSKQGGAWCGSFRDHSITKEGKEIKPLVTLVCNFTRPSGDTPALLSVDEVETLFHEFGHALDGLFAKTSYPASDIAWDFVELPSQIMEHWAMEPEVLKMYARHFQTGEVIPEELIIKLKESGNFNQGFALTEILAASLLDLKLHALTEPVENLNVMDFEKDYLNSIGLIPEIYSRYRSTYFRHIMGGYDAGYYAYTWASVLDNDAFEAFKETSLFDQATAKSFRENVLAMNGIKDAMEMFVAFRGREPKIDALLKNYGIK